MLPLRGRVAKGTVHERFRCVLLGPAALLEAGVQTDGCQAFQLACAFQNLDGDPLGRLVAAHRGGQVRGIDVFHEHRAAPAGEGHRGPIPSGRRRFAQAVVVVHVVVGGAGTSRLARIDVQARSSLGIRISFLQDFGGQVSRQERVRDRSLSVRLARSDAPTVFIVATNKTPVISVAVTTSNKDSPRRPLQARFDLSNLRRRTGAITEWALGALRICTLDSSGVAFPAIWSVTRTPFTW